MDEYRVYSRCPNFQSQSVNSSAACPNLLKRAKSYKTPFASKASGYSEVLLFQELQKVLQ